LQQWESSHPEAKPTKRATPIQALETEQLRALGYIEEAPTQPDPR
jgi:hypothetical protein